MEKEQIVITNSARETEKEGEKFAGQIEVGDVIVLTGNLGSGKTTFVQGVAKGLSIKNRVISPTFVLVKRHRGKLAGQKINLYHIDLYRIEVGDVKNLVGDIFEDENGIFIFEWGEKGEVLNPGWNISFEISSEKRKIKILKNE